MRPFQRINHFPGMMEICRKAALSRHLKRMQSSCPAEYTFAPTTWDYPKELEAFRRYARANPGAVYIVKPTAGAMVGAVQVESSDPIA
jgi:tubulin polyglutamylase TTLL6/13